MVRLATGADKLLKVMSSVEETFIFAPTANHQTDRGSGLPLIELAGCDEEPVNCAQ